MDLTKIPKTIIWGAVAAFVVIILFSLYVAFQYKIVKPYEKFIDIDCTYTNKTAVVVLTAKKDLHDIIVMGDTNCTIRYLSEESMDMCKVQTKPIGDLVLIKVKFKYDNKTLSAVTKCKIEERKSLLDLLLHR